MIEELGANRFAFFRAAGITIEYTRDGGNTWVDYGAADSQKTALFSNGSNSFVIGKADSTNKATANGTNYQLRVTLDTGLGGVYSVLNKFAIYISTSGSSNNTVTIEKALQSTPTTYITEVADVAIGGWPGWNIINIGGITTYGNTPGSQYGRIRFTFKANGGNTNYPGLSVSKIKAFGGQGWGTPSNLAATGHLYSYDSVQDAFFPAQVTATQFNGLATKATGDKNGADITTTYLKLAGGTMTGILTAKGNMYEDSYSGALNMNNSNIYGVNSIYTGDTSDNSQEGIHFYRDTTHVDSIHAKSGVLYFTPNRPLGEVGTSYSIYHTGSKPSKSDVGLGNVENTALSTWAGSSNITTLGTISSGTIPWARLSDVPNYAGSSSKGGAATSLAGFTNTTTSATAIDNATQNGHVYVNGTSTGTNNIYGQSDGAAFVQAYSTSWVAQIYQDYRTGQIALRGRNNGTWQAWRKVLDSTSYTDYTVTKTGSGASGTWGISITGNAANVTGTVTVAHGGTGATSFTSGELLIGNGSNAIGTRSIKNMTTKGNLGWTANGTDIYIPTINTLAYWDGRYNSTSSNLAYCSKGAFGDAAIKGVVTTLDASANLPTASAVKTYIDTTAQNTYVTLTTTQTITGRKTFNDLAAVTFKPSSGTDKCNINYDATLGALVFSF